MAKVKVGQFNEIPEGDLRKYKVGEQAIAVYKINGKIYATSNVCTHEGCFIDENHQMHNDVVECTCHGSQFDVKTGEVLQMPAVEALKTYKASLEGEDIFIEVEGAM